MSTKYLKSAFPRSDIAAVIPDGLKVSIAYTDKGSGEYIREAIGDDALIEQFRVAIDGIEVPKPAPIINPVDFMMLFPAAARVSLRQSVDPVIIDFLRMLDDPRLTMIDRNKSSVIEAIDYCAQAASLTPDQIGRIKTGV